MSSTEHPKRHNNNATIHQMWAYRRSPRNSNDTLDKSIEQMRTISRITNGIYVTQGLIDGSIEPETFISELLSLGSFTPSKIKEMDLKKLKDALEKLKVLPQDITISDIEKKAEQRYLIFDVIRKETADIGDVANLNGLNEYKTDVDSAKALSIDWTKFTELKTAIDGFLNKAKEITELKIDDSNTHKALAYIQDMKEKMDSLETATNAIGRSSDFKNIRNSEQLFRPISKVSKGAQEVELKDPILFRRSADESADQSYQEKLLKISKTSSTLKSTDTVLKDVLSLFESRFKGVAFPKYTSGLIDGPSDINKIFDDLKDSWFRNVVKPADSLEISMSHLKSIGETGNVLDSTLGTSPEERVKAIQEILHRSESISVFSQSLVATMNQIHGCNFGSLANVNNLNKTNTLLANIDSLKKKTNQFVGMTGISNFLLDNVSDMKEVRRLSQLATSNSKTEMQKAQNDLLNHESYKKLHETLSKSTSIFNAATISVVSSSPTIPELAASILTDFAEIGAFQKAVANHVTYFNCLQNVKDVDTIPSAIKTFKSFRESDTKPVEDGISAIDDVTKSVGEFGALEEALAAFSNLKEKADPETKALSLLKNSSFHSNTIGAATRGIVVMKEAINQKAQFDIVQSNLQLVLDELKTVKNLSTGDAENLKKMQNFQKVSDDLEAWKNDVKVQTSSKLKDYAAIFLNAQKVVGIENIKIVAGSVQVLEQLVADSEKKQDLKDLKSALDNLDSIGLKFADYKKQFDDSDETLEVLDLFFSDYVARLNPSKNPSQASISQSTPIGQALIILTSTTPFVTTEASGVTWKVMLGIGCGGVACGLFFLFLAKCKKWCCFEKYKKLPAGPEPEVAPAVVAGSKVDEKVENEEKKKLLEPVVNENDGKSDSTVNLNAEVVVPNAGTTNEVNQKLLKEAGEKYFAEFFKLLIEFQKNNLKIDSDILDGETVLLYSKFLYIQLESNCARRSEEKLNKYSEQTRTYIGLTLESRVLIWDKLSSRCFFKDSYFNCNCFEMPNGSRFFMAETPIKQSGSGKNYSRTVDKFWYMAVQVDCDAIVMLCSKEELRNKDKCEHDDYERGYGDYFPKKKNDVMFQDSNENHNSRFRVTCKEEKKINENLIYRELEFMYEYHPPKQERLVKMDSVEPASSEVFRTETTKEDVSTSTNNVLAQKINEKKRIEKHAVVEAERAQQFRGNLSNPQQIVRTVKHYQLIDRARKTAPLSTENAIKVLENIRNVKNVVVHCSDGVEQTGTFTCAEYARQKLEQSLHQKIQPPLLISVPQIMHEVRKFRNGAIGNHFDIAYLLKLILDLIYCKNRYGRQYLAQYKRFQSCYDRITHPDCELEPQLKVDITEKMDRVDKKGKKKEETKVEKKDKTVIQIESKNGENELEVEETQRDDVEERALVEDKTQEMSANNQV